MTAADMATNYGPGNYTLTANNSGSLANVVVTQNVGASHFVAPPQFTATTFTGLQGMNANQPFTLSWGAFTPDGAINDPLLFLDIVDTDDNMTVLSDALPFGDTSFNLPGGTLTAGTDYSVELDFSSRINVTGNPDQTSCSVTGDTGCPGLVEQGWDTRTLAEFTSAAAVPEPGTLALFGAGLAGLGWLRRRKRNA